MRAPSPLYQLWETVEDRWAEPGLGSGTLDLDGLCPRLAELPRTNRPASQASVLPSGNG